VDLTRHLGGACDFIEEALEGCRNALVHCYMVHLSLSCRAGEC